MGCYSRAVIIDGDAWTPVPNLFDYDALTDLLCSDACEELGATHFAIAYGRDCYCGTAAPDAATVDECTYPNSGAPLEIGGSDTAFSVFSIGPAAPTDGPGGTTQPADVGEILGGNYIGCLKVDTFSGESTTNPAQTQELCQVTCAAFKYFALGNGNACYCDNSLSFEDIAPAPPNEPDSPAGPAQLPPANCNKRAVGRTTQAGGGTEALTAFQNPNYQVRPTFATLCSKLCSANVKKHDPG